MIPPSLVLFLLLVAFVLAARRYYTAAGQPVPLRWPFLSMLAPLLLFVVYLSLSAIGAAPILLSAGFLLVALASLAVNARRLKPKGP